MNRHATSDVADGPTRMLLAADGSTTLLLEALLDRPLTVSVARQRPLPTHRAPERAVRALNITPGRTVIERSSALVTDDGEVMSRNTVVFAVPPRGWSADADDAVPLGQRLRAARTLQHRTLLSSGRANWPDAGQESPCAYKEYLIRCEDGRLLYVHERFNPRHISPPLHSAVAAPVPAAEPVGASA